MSYEVEGCPVAESCNDCGDRQVCELWFASLGFSEEEVNGEVA